MIKVTPITRSPNCLQSLNWRDCAQSLSDPIVPGDLSPLAGRMVWPGCARCGSLTHTHPSLELHDATVTGRRSPLDRLQALCR